MKPRKALALLALHPDQVISVSALVEELWGASPPRSVQTTLQTYILQLRNLIAPTVGHDPDGLPRDAKSVLVTESGGYLLDTQGGTNDVQEFDRLAGAGHRALTVGTPAAASKLFRQALALWRGPALVDVQFGSLLEVEVTRLEASRLTVLSRCIEADLRLGRHHELIGELSGLVARYPLDESLHEKLMLALYRAGRRSSALEIYQRLRAVLRKELGIEPSLALRRMQQAVLASAPELDLRAAPGTPERLLAII
ncbi:BTAD domain-containing putative transcriptional regulator [Streptomyces scopuliridis]|uniref:AfsR/SARP family transcriptional regulator n=1 Tax=Streptomyces scopuliridis TaxID=452529 RepID=UPI0036A10DCD